MTDFSFANFGEVRGMFDLDFFDNQKGVNRGFCSLYKIEKSIFFNFYLFFIELS